MTMLVVGTIAVMAVLATIVSGLDAARVDQGRAAALQNADGGIDAAVAAIDSNDFTGVTWITSGTHFKLSSTTYDVDAVQTSSSSWTVRSVSTDASSGRRRFAVATVATPALFPDAIFSVGTLTATGAPPTSNAGTLGSNGSITLSGSDSSWWTGFRLYGKTTAAAATSACTNCDPAKVTPVANALDTAVPTPPASPLACPAGGVFTGVVSPGDYACTNQDVTFTGPMTIAVTGSGRVRIWVTNGTVNATGSINATGGATDLQLFQTPNADGSTTAASLCGATVVGVLFLPASSVTCAPSAALTITGAVVAGTWNGPMSGVHYDASAATVRRSSGYTLADWHECPSPAGDLSSDTAAWRTSDC